MSKYPEDRKSIIFPLRLNPTLFSLMDNQHWVERRSSNAEFVRICIIEGLEKRGVKVPQPMTWQKKMDMEAERRKAEVDKCFLPLP